MRALTVHQPWASLIIGGTKPVENRTWRPYQTLTEGTRIAIHAAQATPDRRVLRAVQPLLGHKQLPRGVVLGTVGLGSWHPLEECSAGPPCRTWGQPAGWHWMLTDPQAYPRPVHARGQQGLWRWQQPTS